MYHFQFYVKLAHIQNTQHIEVVALEGGSIMGVRYGMKRIQLVNQGCFVNNSVELWYRSYSKQVLDLNFKSILVYILDYILRTPQNLLYETLGAEFVESCEPHTRPGI